MFLRIILLIGIVFFIYSCSSKDDAYKTAIKINPYTSYKEGLDAFERNDFFYASKKFSEAELNFEDIELSAKSAIMSSFSLYGINFYLEASEIGRAHVRTPVTEKSRMPSSA